MTCSNGDCACYAAAVEYYQAAAVADQDEITAAQNQLSEDDTALYYYQGEYYEYNCGGMGAAADDPNPVEPPARIPFADVEATQAKTAAAKVKAAASRAAANALYDKWQTLKANQPQE